MDLDVKNNKGNNCLLLACNNKNSNIIKYLIKDCKMDVKLKNNNGDNCLSFICKYNKNIDLTKFLIEECQTNISY
jgi:hypothetical protein